MALTPSTMMALGTQAPDFALPDTNGQIVKRDDYADQPGLLVMFICNHCPFVVHLKTALADLGRDYGEKIGIVAISSNDAERYPSDGPAAMKAEHARFGYTFPYLFDESQSVARAYDAACTPDFFLFDKGGALVYRGRFDDSRPGNGRPVTGKDLRAALDAVLADQAPGGDQLPSMGCNIKWKPGRAPR